MRRNRTLLVLYAAMLLTLGVADAASAVRLNLQRGRIGITLPSVTHVLIELPNPDEWPATLLHALARAIVEHFSPQESL